MFQWPKLLSSEINFQNEFGFWNEIQTSEFFERKSESKTFSETSILFFYIQNLLCVGEIHFIHEQKTNMKHFDHVERYWISESSLESEKYSEWR